MIKLRKLTFMGLLVALGLVLHLVESFFPLAAIVPGAKLGLANIVTLLGLVLYGWQGGMQILGLRILLGSLLAGTFLTISFYLSLSGGLLSFLIMFWVYSHYKDKFSLVGISVLGAAFHNLGQIIVAYYIIDNPGIFYYLPYLELLALPTGISIGLVSHFTINYLPSRVIGGR